MSNPELCTISIDELDGFRLDRRGRLYWQGEKVRTLIELPDWSKWAGVLVAGASVVSAACEVIRLFKGQQ